MSDAVVAAATKPLGPRAEVVLVSGISGSGKSVALHALEDAGFFCVDNLPPELLRDFIRLEHERFTRRVRPAAWSQQPRRPRSWIRPPLGALPGACR